MDLSKIYLIIVVRIFYTFSEEVFNPDLVVVTGSYIKLISNEKVDTIMDIGMNTVTAAAYDPNGKYVYVSYKIKKIVRIKSTKETKLKVAETIVAKQDRLVNGMAFDHSSSKLYWTTYDGIFYVVVPNDKIETLPTVRVLLKVDVEIPLDIAVDVNTKYLYWVNSDSKTRNATIERIRDNGSDQEVVVRHLTDPRGITVDSKMNKLYWINWSWKSGRSIDSKDLLDKGNRDNVTKDNSTRDTLLHTTEERRPSLIAIGDLNVYWINWASNDLWVMCKKSSKRDVLQKIYLANEPIELFVLSDSYAGSNNDNALTKKSSIIDSMKNCLSGDCTKP